MKNSEMNRRTFLKRSAQATVTASVICATTTSPVFAAEEETNNGYIGSVIDLTACDGCKNEQQPLCVSACKTKNEYRFPQPKGPIKDYWPQKRHEDYSKEQDRIDRLTPYNWTFVEQVTVTHDGATEEIFIPRRCMHCIDAPCQKLCPFGVISKTDQGAVKIDENFCMGGAKCRSVCPWEIPQRQGGVGLYLNIAPDLAGGGVMYKCDMCSDLLAKGEKPACEVACPKDAIQFGPVNEMKTMAEKKAAEIGGYVYGLEENGGTLTYYVSKVPFDKIDAAIKSSKAESQGKDRRPSGRPNMEPKVENMLNTAQGFMLATVIAPIAGAATAGIAAYKTLKGKKNKGGDQDEKR